MFQNNVIVRFYSYNPPFYKSYAVVGIIGLKMFFPNLNCTFFAIRKLSNEV